MTGGWAAAGTHDARPRTHDARAGTHDARAGTHDARVDTHVRMTHAPDTHDAENPGPPRNTPPHTFVALTE